MRDLYKESMKAMDVLDNTIIGVERDGILYAGVININKRTITTKEYIFPLSKCIIVRNTFGVNLDYRKKK